ncbi:MAG: SDR family oxidoreductase [Trueperaceae bacterium]|nr:SDR family oxidoreductase [Trueperaceae bacterium]
MKQPTQTVSVLGCGWLGMALAERLVKVGYVVKGSSTTPSKLEVIEVTGARPYLVELSPSVPSTLRGPDVGDFFDADTLIVSMTPPRGSDAAEVHRAQLAAVRQAAEDSVVNWVIFISSTSVYPNLNRTVVETDAGDPDKSAGVALLAAEAVLQQATVFDTTVLRLAGLYGYDRQPGRFLAGKQDMPGGNAPINLVHHDDVIAVVGQVLEQRHRSDVLNVCAPHHPARRDFYAAAAHKLGLTPPSFNDVDTDYKIVSSDKLRAKLGYTFRHLDPLGENVP